MLLQYKSTPCISCVINVFLLRHMFILKLFDKCFKLNFGKFCFLSKNFNTGVFILCILRVTKSCYKQLFDCILNATRVFLLKKRLPCLKKKKPQKGIMIEKIKDVLSYTYHKLIFGKVVIKNSMIKQFVTEFTKLRFSERKDFADNKRPWVMQWTFANSQTSLICEYFIKSSLTSIYLFLRNMYLKRHKAAIEKTIWEFKK